MKQDIEVGGVYNVPFKGSASNRDHVILTNNVLTPLNIIGITNYSYSYKDQGSYSM